MSANSEKHRAFVSEPMGDKPVTDLPGIGPTLGSRLQKEGLDKAYKLLGQYLQVGKKEEIFKKKLKDTFGADEEQASACYACLKEWSNNHL
ncbi:barrier-to-autointegration factor-like [Lampetra fluviatilis]